MKSIKAIYAFGDQNLLSQIERFRIFRPTQTNVYVLSAGIERRQFSTSKCSVSANDCASCLLDVSEGRSAASNCKLDETTMVDYVAYYRVSTEKQGKSGLGLAAQRANLEAFLSSNDRILQEFVDVQSGRKDDRSGLNKALAFAKAKKATLLIAKLDRFSRRVSFIAKIMDEGISLCCAEMPNATEFQLHIFAALAQEERRLISERTKAALAETKKRGRKLGANGARLAIVNKEQADAFARSVSDVVYSIGIEKSYSEVARKLNEQGMRTRTGRLFYAQTVKNVAQRLIGGGPLSTTRPMIK